MTTESDPGGEEATVLRRRVQRERAARLDAERMGEEATRRLYDNQRDVMREGARLQDTQRAILNILEDAGAEKLRIEATQKAVLNILADFGDEKARLADVQKAILNIIEDAGAEKLKLEDAQKATLNILEDFDAEKNKVEQVNREMAGEIAERKRAEEALEAANKELEAFSYSVSHDLRSPLRAIDGFSRLLTEDYGGKFDEEGRRLLGVIRDSTKKMGRLIDDLLTFSRLGRQSLSAAEIDMKRLVEVVLGELQVSGEKLPRLVLGALPPVRGDATLLRQAWSNLLANAIKFSGKRERPVIEVSGHENGAECVYCVKDNGAGFDMQYYHKLFGVFQRLHRTDEFAGTGVGLAIVQRVVSRHGGRVWAEGKVGEGAAFHFSLPKEKHDGQV